MLNTLQLRINQHQFLTELRVKLMRLHKVLLEMERNSYEQVRGKVSKGELLQLVIDHDQFAWLHRLSKQIVQIDDLLHADEPVTAEAIDLLINKVRILLTPNEWGDDFATKYHAAFQHHPDAVLAHADVVMLLASDI